MDIEQTTEKDGIILDFGKAFQQMKKSPPFVEWQHFQQLQERILVINDEIDDYLIDDVVMPILEWNEKDKNIPVEERKPIKLYINSDGGSLDVAFAVWNVITTSKTPVYTYVIGRAYSAGALILIAGHVRYGYEFSKVLIHDGNTGVINSTSKVQDFAKFQKIEEGRIRDFICSRTKITPKLYDKNLRREWFLFAQDALELGIIDEIIR